MTDNQLHDTMKKGYDLLSDDLAKRSKRGLPMILTGVVFWLVAGIAGILVPDIAVWVYLYGIGAIFPIGLLIARLMKIDMLAKFNPLSTLAGAAGGLQILFAPIVILVLMNRPEWMPFVVGVLTGAHFLPFAVIYKSKAYLFQSFAVVIVASVCAIFFMAQSFVVTSFAVMIVYIVTCLGIIAENRKAGS